MIQFGRGICGNLAEAEKREWLTTNSIGGYASGTVSGLATRRYHGLLVAALQPPVGRTLLAAKLDETVHYAQADTPLHVNRWQGGAIDPVGYLHIERFELDGTMPVWIYAFADGLLEKRIWMAQGANTTYVQYRFVRGTEPMVLEAKLFVNYRDHHSQTRADNWQMHVDQVANGLKVRAYDGATSFYALSDRAKATAVHDWHHNFFYMIEANRGLEARDDHLQAGLFTVNLAPGENVTLVLSTEAEPLLDGAMALAAQQAHEAKLIETAVSQLPALQTTPALRQLVLAASQFVVKRPSAADPNGRSIIAGYPWFGDWGRDTMIALPGLTLSTGHPDIAAKILRTYALFVDQGMLPNRFPDSGETPEYNTVDATLWYFEAMRAYYEATGDKTLVQQLFSVLVDIIAWHERGTRYNIKVDPADGLLYAGDPSKQLTWMDAKIGDWVVTPRIGKPVEVNALWYNALCIMADFAKLLEAPTREKYVAMAAQTEAGFARFWHQELGYCYDVLDTPDGDNDEALRPNQILAVSLPNSPLSQAQQTAVVDTCAKHLLTSHGLRSLAPGQAGYIGSYGGSVHQRDSVYHQGTVWSWLIGPFVKAHWRVYNDPAQARSFLTPLFQHLNDHGLGTISEIFDGDAPYTPRGTIAQAWSVAEVLSAWEQLG
ncbi:MAG: amylo-alpha-1,6-glucosidase [Chloroflexota bacterium]